jgi:hypothetical protein
MENADIFGELVDFLAVGDSDAGIVSAYVHLLR